MAAHVRLEHEVEEFVGSEDLDRCLGEKCKSGPLPNLD